ncbi:MAG: DUF4174 domain-containing protein [Boseongicola sp.]|nr:DUF4174 domain-containing protein [Boseongicola sp.]NNL17386.1 DUF4174 domain-containing protein [Boseongicola sp.]
MTALRITLLLSSVALAVSATIASAADGASTDLAPVEVWQADKSTIFDAQDIDLEAFRWIARPVVVFADTPADPAFQQQIILLEDRMDELVERDVVLITDTSRSELSSVRKKLRPRGFMLTLIGKDGGVKLRKPFPWDVRELSRSIDKMPLRRQEIRDSALSD